MSDSIYNFLLNTFLFSDFSIEELKEALSPEKIEIKSFERNDVIYSTDCFERKLGFVYDGECVVCSHGNQKDPTSLNTLSKYQSFGIITVFSGYEQFPTTVYAKKKTTVVFLNQSTVNDLVLKNGSVSVNIIKFLSNKVLFLNDKIATFSSSDVEQKLLSYLKNLVKKENKYQFEFNKAQVANAIGVGRASLYRAMSALAEQGIIEVENKKIIIKNSDEFERKLK